MNDLTPSEKSLLDMVNDPALKLNLLNIREAAHGIWSSAVRIIKDYTDHGFPHSQRLAENAEKILRPHIDVSLSKEEIYLLLAGIYLHDIGMQCDVVKHPKIKAKAEELGAQFDIDFTTTGSSNYSLDEQKALRQNHHYLSAAWISFAHDTGTTDLGAAAQKIPSYLVEDLMDVCRFHSQLDINQCPLALKATPSGRKRLVAALLRHADELDIDKKRVDFAVVKNFVLSPKNAVFWWLHELTHVDISATIVTLTIFLHQDDAGVFKGLIEKEVISKFIAKNQPVIDILRAYGINIAISASSKVVEDSHTLTLPPDIKEELQRIAASSGASPVTGPVAHPSPIPPTPSLQKFKTLDLELTNPRRHPNRKDFEQGRYYQNQDLHRDVRKYLQDNRRCLILGPPGSGKTALARGVGFALSQEAPPWQVFYLSADWKSSAAEWLADLARGDQEGVLFILDNCHQAIEAVNDLLERWSLIREARLLLISRDINPDLAGPTEDNYLAALAAENVPVKVDKNTINQVIQALQTHWQDKGKDLGDLEAISQKCQGDLHLLNFYLDAWLNPDSGYHRLSEVPETAVLEDVYRYYLQGEQHLAPLLDIAALSQLEIPVQADWLGTSMVIDAIQASGLVDEIIENVGQVNTPFLQYFHSTPARYLLKAATHKGRLAQEVDDFTAATIERYLKYKPVNFFEVFGQLYLGGRLDLQHHLLEGEKMLDRALSLAREWPDVLFRRQFVDLSWFIFAIWDWEGRQTHGLAEIFLQEIKDGVGETRWREFWAWASPKEWNAWLLLSKVAPSFYQKWLSGVDFAALSLRYQDGGVPNITKFLNRVSPVGVAKKQLMAFFNELDFAALGRRCQNSGVATVNIFLWRCSQAGVAKERLQEFFNELDFAALGQRSRTTKVSWVIAFLGRCSKAGVAKEQLLPFFNELDFSALGQSFRDRRVATVKRFMQQCSKAGVSKERLQEFFNELDFSTLDQHFRDTELATIILFMQLYSQTGVKTPLQEFCKGLDFIALDQYIRANGVANIDLLFGWYSQAEDIKEGLQEFFNELDFSALGQSFRNREVSAVREFMQLCFKAGVGKEGLQEFFNELDFSALGQSFRNREVSAVREFMQLCFKAGVGKKGLQEFFNELDFSALGQSFRDSKLATVKIFMQLCAQLKVTQKKWEAFCESLDWHQIGRRFIDTQGNLRSPVYKINILLRVKGITRKMAREVIEGMGWETLTKAIKGCMSPADVAAAWQFLRVKCRFTPNELRSHGIDFSSPILWFQAFANIPGPKLDEDSLWLAMENYYTQALAELDKLGKEYIQQQVLSKTFSLQAWTVLIHNLLQADENRIIRDLVPVLQSLTAADYDRLIGSASLEDIGRFLSRFNPQEGIFSFQLPTGINFQGIDFLRRVEESTLESIAFFLFNFHIIDRPDLSAYFAGELKKDPELILAKIKEAELKEVGFFLWNLWLALPQGEIPFLLIDDKFLEIIREKADHPQVNQEGLLGLLGVFGLAGVEPPPDLLALTDPQTAKQLCLSAAEKEDDIIKLTRLLSGLLSAHPGVLSEEERNRLKESLTKIDQTLQVPNQEFARNKILAWLSDSGAPVGR